MEHRTRRVTHLIELINAAHSAVGEDEGAGLEDHAARPRVLRDVRGEAHRGGA